MDTWKCCYDANSETKCFLPAGSPEANHDPNTPTGSTGISNAGAAVLTAFFFILIPIGYFAFSRYCGTATPWNTGFSNPAAEA